jgi:hypothetical protein
VYKIFVGKNEGKRSLGRPRCKWVHNIRIYLGEIEWEVVDWIHLAQDRDRGSAVVNTITNLLDSIEGGECIE